jgi:hypothetical protein
MVIKDKHQVLQWSKIISVTEDVQKCCRAHYNDSLLEFRTMDTVTNSNVLPSCMHHCTNHDGLVY